MTGANEDASAESLAEDDPELDLTELWIANQSGPRSARRLPGLLLRATKLVMGADRRSSLWTLGLQLSTAGLAAVQVLASKDAITAVLKARTVRAATGSLVLDIAVLSGATAATAVAGAIQQQQQRLLSEQAQRQVWQRLLDVSIRVPLVAFESPRFYNHLKRVQANSLDQPVAVATGLVTLVGGAFAVIAISVTVFTLQPLLVPLMVVAGVPSLLLSRRGSRTEFGFALSQSDRFRMRYYLREILTNRSEAKELRAFGAGGYLRERHDNVSMLYIAALRSQVRKRQRLAVASAVMAAIGNAGALALVVWLLVDRRLSVGAAGGAAVAVQLLGSRLNQVFTGISSLYQSSLFLSDMETFFDAAPAVVTTDSADSSGRDEAVEPSAGFRDLAVHNLTFTYPGSTRPALSDISLDIRQGEMIALVGENGSGKTTLAKLLAGLYQPSEGSIYWDGIDTRDIPSSRMRSSTAVIFQDFVRYQFSAHENIALGRSEFVDDRDRSRLAAEQARAHQFLAELPAGYDTPLSKEFRGGYDLSVGQWQRVALARAFFRDSPFIVLDEPSSALDPRAEHQLFEDLRRLAADRSVLFISHRFSTVRTADRILVLKQGRLVETGSHAELVSANGLYADLFALQARAYQH